MEKRGSKDLSSRVPSAVSEGGSDATQKLVGKTDNSTPAPLAASEVAAYLRRNPDFLIKHSDLLAVLVPPDDRSGDNVVDMQNFMLQRLRQDVVQLRTQQKSLIGTSRANLASQTRVHAAVLAVIGARSFEQLIHLVTSEFTIMLDVDVAMLCVEADEGDEVRVPHHGVQLLAKGSIDRLMGGRRDVLISEQLEGDPIIFGSGAGLVRSQALLRLSIGGTAPEGMIALGSRRGTRFRQSQGTEMLSFLIRSLEVTISQWLMLDDY